MIVRSAVIEQPFALEVSQEFHVPDFAIEIEVFNQGQVVEHRVRRGPLCLPSQNKTQHPNQQQTGDPNGQQIAPFIILPIVENGFRQLACLNLPEKFMNLEIRIFEGNFRMKLSWSKPNDSSTLTGGDRPSLQSIGNRLNLLYPQSHDLKIIITSGHFMIDLQMDLHGAVNK